MVEDQPPTYHPPPYGTDTHDEAAPSPSYELSDLGAPPPPSDLARPPPHPLSHPASSSHSLQSGLTLDEATIEGCAPKKPPRPPLIPPWLFRSRKGKAFVGAVVLPFAALIGAMIWYGVHRSEVNHAKDVRARRVDVYMDTARATVLPQVPSGLVAYDEDLITSFNFTSPLASQILFKDNAGTSSIYTVFTSTLHQPLRLVSVSNYYIKVFGSRSSKVTFVPAAPGDETDAVVVNVTAIWKGGGGWSEQDSMARGAKELGLVSGGMHGSNWTGSGGVKGVGLFTSPSSINDESYQPANLATPFDSLPDWNNTLVFNITVTMPHSHEGGYLDIYGESAMAVEFADFSQTNATFFDVDVRVPKGSITSYGGFNTTSSLSLLSLLPIYGRFTVSHSLTFISNSTIKTELFVLPFTAFSTANFTHSATHNFTFLQLNPLSSSVLQTNITSFPAHGNLTLTALNLNGSVGLAMPFDVYEGTVKEGTNNGRAQGFATSWQNSTQYPRSPDSNDFVGDKDTDGWDAGFSWIGAEVVWHGEGGTSVGKGKGDISLMTNEGHVFFGAGTGYWVFDDGYEAAYSLFP